MQNEAAKNDGRAETGIAGLDDVLGGGFPEGHFFLVQGEPGTGKTTLGLQFLMAGARKGESVLYVTLSESRREIEKIARSHQWSLDGVRIFEFTPTEDALHPDDQYSAFHPSEIEFQDTTQTILKEVDAATPVRVVLDSLSELRLLARDSLRYRRQILALKHFFTKRNCTLLLLDDNVADNRDLQLQSIAHGVLTLEKIQREFGKTRRRIHVAKMRGSTFREGYHDYNIETGGMAVYARLVALEHRHEMAAGVVTSGLPALDAIWDGGIDRGSSTLMIGPAGCGKSSVAMSYAVSAARRGESASIFLFEEWARTACKRSKGLGIDPQPFVDSGKLHLEQIDPAELAPGQFIEHVRKSVDVGGAKVVVIDSLNGFMNAMPGENFLPLQMHELLSYLNQRGVATIMVLAQIGTIGASMVSPMDLSYLADNILLFRYFETPGRIRKAISVMKKRSGSHEETIRELFLTPGAIKVGNPLSEFRGVLSGTPIFIGVDSNASGSGSGSRE